MEPAAAESYLPGKGFRTETGLVEMPHHYVGGMAHKIIVCSIECHIARTGIPRTPGIFLRRGDSPRNEHVAYLGRKRRHRERFRDIVVRPCLECGKFVFHLGFHGEHDDRDVHGVLVVFYTCAQPDAVQDRHHHVGDNEVKITYNDASTSVTVTGVKFVETSVTYSDTPSLGDSFDEGLLTVIAVYDDGIKNVEKEVKKFTYDIDDINADGQFTDTYVTVEVSYTDEFGVNRTGSGDIEVAHVAPVAVGLEVSLADPDKTFYVGDSITKNDLIVYAVYKNVFGNESREKIDGYAITKPNGGTFDKAGDCEVTVAWNDLTGSTSVTVVEKEHKVWVDVSDTSKFYHYAFDVIYAPYVTDGGSFTFKVQMRPDKADAWKVGGADVKGDAGDVEVKPLGDDKYQITVLNIRSDITITVKFESVTPQVNSITVAWKSGATIYVGDTIDNDNWSNYLTVKASDADGNEIENPNITLSDSHTFKEATKYTRYAFTFEVNGASKSAIVAFEVKMPTFTLDSNNQTFRQGSSLFHYKDSGADRFRTGMRFKRTDKESYLPITQPMVETTKNISVISYTDPNGTEYPIYPSTSFGFTSPGAWKAQVYYYDTSADITYEFTIDITVTP